MWVVTIHANCDGELQKVVGPFDDEEAAQTYKNQFNALQDLVHQPGQTDEQSADISPVEKPEFIP